MPINRFQTNSLNELNERRRITNNGGRREEIGYNRENRRASGNYEPEEGIRITEDAIPNPIYLSNNGRFSSAFDIMSVNYNSYFTSNIKVKEDPKYINHIIILLINFYLVKQKKMLINHCS